jgi:hypothetical protein
MRTAGWMRRGRRRRRDRDDVGEYPSALVR